MTLTALSDTMLDQLISWAALFLSGIALIVAFRVQRRQPELIAKQIAELERGAKQRHEAHVVAELQRSDAWVGAGGRLAITITNEGPAEAREIDIQFPDGNSPIPQDEARTKLPIPVLQAGGHFDLIAAVSNDNPPPFHVVLRWHDGLGEQVQKTTIG